jgi:pimeloyl-ACP methyl ester carboxylesterase
MYVALPDGTKIYYNVNNEEKFVASSSEVLILLHGGPGLADHTVYVPFWSKLSGIIQVVFIDMRGHGRSDGHYTPESWTLKQWGQDVYDFCNALNIEKPIVAGVSFGGWVALSYATQYPEHARALMLCHTEAKVDIETRKRAYSKKAALLGQSGPEISDIVQRMYDWESGAITRELYLKYCIPLYSKQPYIASGTSDCIRNTNVWDSFGKKQYDFDFLPELHNIEIPALVLTGEQDPEHPPEFAEAMASKLPHAQLVVVEDAGAPAYRDKEEETLAILIDQVEEWIVPKV